MNAIPKVKLYRYLIPLVFVCLAVAILLTKVSSLKTTISAIRQMPLWIVGLAAVAQVISYLGNGYLLKVIVSRVRYRLSVVRGALITVAADTIGLASGAVGAAAATYYWTSKNNDDAGEAALAGIIPILYNAIVIIIITIIGMAYLLLMHELSSTQIIVYGSVLAIIIAGVLIALYGLRHRDAMTRIILRIAKKANTFRFIKRKKDLALLEVDIEDFYDSMELLKNRGWIKLGLGPTLNTFFDMLTLYLFFIAAGYLIQPSVLLAGFSLSFLFGRYAFLVPGGAGIVEGGMVVIFSNLGVPSNICVVAVLGYRFLSFWLPSLLGFPAMAYLQRTTGQRRHKRKSI
jgi:glycosyltransferase 2 family protein